MTHGEDEAIEQAQMAANGGNVVPLRAPTTEPEQPAPAPLTAEQLKAQAVVAAQDYATMMRSNIITLRAELTAAEFMLAELEKQGDVQVKKKRFMKAAGRFTGPVLPEFTEAALNIIANKFRK